MTYTVAADRSGMACTVTSTDAKHGFRLVTTYITDPARDTVLMQTKLEGSAANLRTCTCTRVSMPTSTATGEAAPRTPARTPAWWTPAPARPIPVVFSTNTVTNAVNRNYAVPTYMALAASTADNHRERRLRGHRQRRPHPARRLPRPHQLQHGPRRPHRGHRSPDPGPRRPADPGPRLRPDPGPGGLHRGQLPEPPVRPGQAAVPRRAGPPTTPASGSPPRTCPG